MRYYFAPMEGITDSIYRRLHHAHFGGVDRYYMPFFSPTMHQHLSVKEDRELPTATSVAFPAVPQVLTKSPEDFLWAANLCKERGYSEVNLNVGCPSGTVVAKGKGAGMLSNLSSLNHFLDRIFTATPLPVSIKTRLGIANPDQFPAILDIYNQYPITELIIHPRVRNQFYQGDVTLEMFHYAVSVSSNPLCYNGDLLTMQDCHRFASAFPKTDAVMIGRGLVANPGMLLPSGITPKALEVFHNALLEEYLSFFGGSRNAMFRLKENWSYWLTQFQEDKKLTKRLHKTTDLTEYRQITEEIFHTLPLKIF